MLVIQRVAYYLVRCYIVLVCLNKGVRIIPNNIVIYQVDNNTRSLFGHMVIFSLSVFYLFGPPDSTKWSSLDKTHLLHKKVVGFVDGVQVEELFEAAEVHQEVVDVLQQDADYNGPGLEEQSP